MITYRYTNTDNFMRLAKYIVGFFIMYGITIHYIVNERESKNFHMFIAAGLIVMCCLVSMPVLKMVLKVFFENISVNENEIVYSFLFSKIVMPWKRVQYFIRLPSRGFFAGLIIYYEMGDFKKKIRFESTITNRDELIKYIQNHVGKLRKVRKTFR